MPHCPSSMSGYGQRRAPQWLVEYDPELHKFKQVETIKTSWWQKPSNLSKNCNNFWSKDPIVIVLISKGLPQLIKHIADSETTFLKAGRKLKWKLKREI
jgi:hypothetical protein